MTACTNHGGKARRVVTAALVGVLSVGTVPMVALAANDGISTMALSASDAFKNGEMTEARDSQNRRLDIPSDGVVTVEAGNYVVPRVITPKDGNPVTIIPEGADKNADINFYKEGYSPKYCSWATRNTAGLWDAGTYTVEVTMTIDGTPATFEATFIVEDAADLSKATIFDGKGGVTDTTFTYNGKAQDVRVAIDGKELKSGYHMDLYKYVGAGKGDSGNNLEYNNMTGTGAVEAGTYVANISETAGGAVEKQITFTVNKLDLSTVTVDDVAASSSLTAEGAVTQFRVNGTDVLNVATEKVQAIATVPAAGETGKASVVLSATSASENVTGSATVEFNVVEKVLNNTNIKYNDDALPASNEININLADGESFKPERIEVFGTVSGTTYKDKLDASYYTVSYTDGEGNAVDASALSNPGVYNVHVRVNAEASHFEYGSGDMAFTVVVSNGTVTSNDVVFKFDGKVGTYFDPTYDGTDMLDRFETVVHTKWGDDLVAGTDYTVEVTNEDDEKVDSIVDAGTYTVTVTVPGYGTEACTIDVQQLDLDTVFVNGGDLAQYTYVEEGRFPWLDRTVTVWYLGYTGEDLEPSFELGYYTDADGAVVEVADAAQVNADPSAYTWHALTADEIEVTGYTDENGKSVDAMNAKGKYNVQFALNSDNYTTSATKTSNVITVSDAKVGFVDVSADAWYAQGVFDAKQLGYVKGVSGTDMYAPESKISRADALIIISRMAGFDQTVTAEDYLSVNGGYVTRYTDVDMGAYYAKAVAWGTKMGIVNGYGDGTFGPDDPITREQFAGMLANYAKATGDYATPSADALDGIADASSVDAWANEAVSWAVENGVMGNGGYVYAQNEISRAEVACMAVNYQPEGANTSVIG